jgi:histidyl-tRNA synthetase
MSGQVQAVRGTRDLLGDDCRRHRHVVETAIKVCGLFGFEEIETPILESKAVFSRSLGETSDVVMKEMYAFQDRGGHDVVMRPEGTAGVARAFINAGLAQQIPLKLFYTGPMFRYERPQKGRYRQFYQFGAELIGSEKAQADIETIALGAQILKELKLLTPQPDSPVKLLINTLGDSESRTLYREALVQYFRTRESELSEDSRIRLEKNPLRILDSKDDGDKKILVEAPRFAHYLNDISKKFFDEVLEGLTVLNIAYELDPLLVRGLDYYVHTVFEFTTTTLGAQGAVLSGGRYDGLIKELGGPAMPAVGWGAGIDRLALMIAEPQSQPQLVAVIPTSPETEKEALKLLGELRAHGVAADLAFSGNVAKRFKRADKLKARYALVLGETELARQMVVVKDLSTGEQKEVDRASVATTLFV